MSESATINLATVGTAELEAMSVADFTINLDKMSGEAIARFRKMRKLSNNHRQALEKYLVAHPEKRPGGADDTDPPSPAKSGKPAGVPKRSPFPNFKLRLRAWWEGVDVKDLADGSRPKPASGKPAKKAEPTAEAGKAAATNNAPAAPVQPKARSSVEGPGHDRIQIIQTLWGVGFHLPGGEAFALRLAGGIPIQPGLPCLDISAGLGGAARALAQEHRTVVEGIEADPELAAAGQMLSQNSGMAGKVSIRAGAVDTEALEDGRYQAIFAREFLYKTADRRGLLAKLRQALTPDGRLAVTDFALSNHNGDDKVVSAWRAMEPLKPIPAKIDEYGELLSELKFNVHAFEDLTAEYLPLVQAGWKRLHTCLQNAKLPPETAAMLIEEGNLWLARSRALESGRLRLLHFTALPQEAN